MAYKTYPFYAARTLLGFGVGQQDLNRVTLHGPRDFAHTLIEMNEPRDDALSRAWVDGLVRKLNAVWPENAD